jgi:cytochrome c oxidase subunit 2
VSSLLCLFLFIWGEVELTAEQASASAPGGLVVQVTGQQWAWTFTYPSGYTSNELVLPVDKPVTFKVTSNDVVHSFWIVQMGTKVDANPGETTTTSVTPDKLGNYVVRCAELCGIYHSYMDSPVHVVSAADYQSWLSANGAKG